MKRLYGDEKPDKVRLTAWAGLAVIPPQVIGASSPRPCASR